MAKKTYYRKNYYVRFIRQVNVFLFFNLIFFYSIFALAKKFAKCFRKRKRKIEFDDIIRDFFRL